MKDIGKSELDSIIDIAEDVEFVDSFDFDSTEIDKLQDQVGIDEHHMTISNYRFFITICEFILTSNENSLFS